MCRAKNFVPEGLKEFAYEILPADRAGQTISSL